MESTKTVNFNGLEIELERKRIRTLRLSVNQNDARIHLSIPFYCSEKYALEFVAKKQKWLVKTAEKTKERIENAKNSPEIVKERSQQEAELNEILPQMIAEWEFRLGVKVKEWNLRKMKSRWGSCKTNTAKITFNTELANKPLRCIEYVVAHELTHLLVADHSKKFYATMAKHFPFWREIKKALG